MVKKSYPMFTLSHPPPFTYILHAAAVICNHKSDPCLKTFNVLAPWPSSYTWPNLGSPLPAAFGSNMHLLLSPSHLFHLSGSLFSHLSHSPTVFHFTWLVSDFWLKCLFLREAFLTPESKIRHSFSALSPFFITLKETITKHPIV